MATDQTLDLSRVSTKALFEELRSRTHGLTFMIDPEDVPDGWRWDEVGGYPAWLEERSEGLEDVICRRIGDVMDDMICNTGVRHEDDEDL